MLMGLFSYSIQIRIANMDPQPLTFQESGAREVQYSWKD
jgi:hypothetical protein